MRPARPSVTVKAAACVPRRPMAAAALAASCVLSCALNVPAQAAERSWLDTLTTPFADPLQARPPVLDSGKTLPGDDAPYRCRRATDNVPTPLTLPDAVDLALCNNQQVQSAWAGIKL